LSRSFCSFFFVFLWGNFLNFAFQLWYRTFPIPVNKRISIFQQSWNIFAPKPFLFLNFKISNINF
jgi:hypothetical protein